MDNTFIATAERPGFANLMEPKLTRAGCGPLPPPHSGHTNVIDKDIKK